MTVWEALLLPLAILSSAFRRLPLSVGGFFRRHEKGSVQFPIVACCRSSCCRLVSAPAEVLRSIDRADRHGNHRFKRVEAISCRFSAALLTKLFVWPRKQTRTVTPQSANWSKNAFSRCKIWWKQKLVVLLQSQTGQDPVKRKSNLVLDCWRSASSAGRAIHF